MEIAAIALLGIAIGAAGMWLVQRWRGPRNPAFYRFGDRGPAARRLARLRSVAPMARSPVQPSPEDLGRMLRMSELVTALEESPLRRVVGVGQAATVGDVTVELLAVEIRAAGCRGSLRYRSTAEDAAVTERHGRAPLPQGVPFPDVVVSDDAGTAYEVAPGHGGGTARGAEYSFVFVPRPPDAARRLTVSIPRFGPDPFFPFVPREAAPDVPGPWDFNVTL